MGWYAVEIAKYVEDYGVVCYNIPNRICLLGALALLSANPALSLVPWRILHDDTLGTPIIDPPLTRSANENSHGYHTPVKMRFSRLRVDVFLPQKPHGHCTIIPIVLFIG